MTLKLKYDLITEPYPLRANSSGGSAAARLTVVASNPGPDPGRNPVTLRGLSITIRVGGDADELTNDAAGVVAVAPDGWTPPDEPKKGDHTAEYIFTPQPGQGVVGGQGLAFFLNKVTPNTQPGPTEVTVKEGSAGNPTKVFKLTKFPSTWKDVDFSVVPSDVPYGGATTLSWDGPAGATYTIEYMSADGSVVKLPPAGEGPFGSSGQYPVSALARTTVFTLYVSETVEGQSYRMELQKTVTVGSPAPEVRSFGGRVEQADGRAVLVLNWETKHADYCQLAGDATELTPDSPAGGYRVELSRQNCLRNSYALTAKNRAGEASSSISLAWVAPGPTETSYRPYNLVFSPDGASLYGFVTSADGVVMSVCALDARTLQPLRPPVPVAFRGEGLAVSPDGARLYACVGYSGEPFLYVLDASTLTVVQKVEVDGQIAGVAASPDGSFLYLADFNGAVRVKAVADLQAAGASVPVDCNPMRVAASADGERVYFGVMSVHTNDGWVMAFAPTPDGSLKLVGQSGHTSDCLPFAFAVAPDGSRLYEMPLPGPRLLAFDAALRPAAAPAQDLDSPFSLAVSPDGSRLYVSADAGFYVFAPEFGGGAGG